MSRDENNSFRSVAPTLTAEKKKLFQIFLKAQKNKKTKKKTHTHKRSLWRWLLSRFSFE